MHGRYNHFTPSYVAKLVDAAPDFPHGVLAEVFRLSWAHGESFDADPDYFMGEI